MAQTNQPPISEDHTVSSWRLDVTRNVNEMDSRVTALETDTTTTTTTTGAAVALFITNNDLNVTATRGTLGLVEADLTPTLIPETTSGATGFVITWGAANEPSLRPRHGQIITGVGSGAVAEVTGGYDTTLHQININLISGSLLTSDEYNIVTPSGLYYNRGTHYRRLDT